MDGRQGVLEGVDVFLALASSENTIPYSTGLAMDIRSIHFTVRLHAGGAPEKV